MKFKFINHLFTKSWCENIIHLSERYKFKRQKLYNKNLKKYIFSDKRKSLLSNFKDDPNIKQFIIQNIQSYFNSFKIHIHKSIRIIKYNKDGCFKFHKDLEIVENNMKNFTMLIYLNDNFYGGNTLLVNDKKLIKIPVEEGSVLIFDPNIIHSGSRIEKGKKYIISLTLMVDKSFNLQTE